MTETLNALDKLIEAVEAGTSDRQALLHMIDKAMPQDNRGCMAMAHQAYHGSLDAALALHEALLPGWALERLTKWPGTNGQCTAYLWGTHEQDGERWHNAKDGRVDASGPTPACAWLLAVLRAYRSVQA